MTWSWSEEIQQRFSFPLITSWLWPLVSWPSDHLLSDGRASHAGVARSLAHDLKHVVLRRLFDELVALIDLLFVLLVYLEAPDFRISLGHVFAIIELLFLLCLAVLDDFKSFLGPCSRVLLSLG